MSRLRERFNAVESQFQVLDRLIERRWRLTAQRRVVGHGASPAGQIRGLNIAAGLELKNGEINPLTLLRKAYGI